MKDLRGWAGALAAVAACTAVDALLFPQLHQANLAMVYMLGVLGTAWSFGLGPSIAASVASVLAFDFFFTLPRFSLTMDNVQDVFTCGVMLLVAVAISHLTVLARQQAALAEERERRTRSLYELSAKMASAHGTAELLRQVLDHVGAALECSVTALVPDAAGTLQFHGAAGPSAPMPEDERSAADMALRSGFVVPSEAGNLTDPRAVYVPLTAAGEGVGVLRVAMAHPERLLGADQVKLLEAFAGQAAQAIAGELVMERQREAQGRADADRVRATLLQAVSGDLAVPLAAIRGTVDALGRTPLDAAGRSLLGSLREDADRLERALANAAMMSRPGPAPLRTELRHPAELVATAVARYQAAAPGRVVTVELAPHLPVVPMDALLLDQVLARLLARADRASAAAASIRVSARSEPGWLIVGVSWPGEESRESGTDAVLAFCRQVVEAHGGTIERIASREDAGTCLRLPVPRPSAL